MDLPAELVAEIITSFESQLFQNIPRIEFLDQKNRPNIDKMVSHFNNVRITPVPSLIALKMASHIATQILTCKNEHQKVLERWIHIAVECVKLGNYNAAMEMIAGLTNCAVHRLQDQWKAVPEKLKQQFEDIETLMQCMNNYGNYRKQLNERKEPTVPYLGIFLRDLLFTKEGNAVRGPTGEINLNFVKLTANILSDITKFQSTSYSFKHPPIGELPHLDEEELFKLSEQLRLKQKRYRSLRHSSPTDSRLRVRSFSSETIKLLSLMLNETSGVPVQKGERQSKMYFAGNELVDWLVSFRQGYTREAAVLEAQSLHEQGIFKSVCPFIDGPYKYYWTVSPTEVEERMAEPQRKRRSLEV